MTWDAEEEVKRAGNIQSFKSREVEAEFARSQ